MLPAGTPAKLKRDAITEALVEIRFDIPANVVAPEVLLGRLVDNSSWTGFEHRRFPIAEMPPAMRAADPQFKYLPVIELKENNNGPRSVRIGPNVLSFHRAAPYVGWSVFKPEIDALVTDLFTKAPGIAVSRLGLRYVNALNQKDHEVATIADLTLATTIRSERLVQSLVVASQLHLQDGSMCVLRIATMDFLPDASLPAGTACVIDVDVYKDKAAAKSASEVLQWMEFAHNEEKVQFFKLLDDDKVARLREA